jgi:hypothetical protein
VNWLVFGLREIEPRDERGGFGGVVGWLVMCVVWL